MVACNISWYVSAPSLTTRDPSSLSTWVWTLDSTGLWGFRKGREQKRTTYCYQQHHRKKIVTVFYFKDENKESNIAKLCDVCKCRVVAMYVRIALCCRRRRRRCDGSALGLPHLSLVSTWGSDFKTNIVSASSSTTASKLSNATWHESKHPIFFLSFFPLLCHRGLEKFLPDVVLRIAWQ